MKIEIGESLCYSYLRHVKQCWLVQANWKASENWRKIPSDESLETIFAHMKEKFDSDGSVFKGTRTCSQFLKQGEIDVVGVGLDGGIHAMEVAYHEAGLNYVGGVANKVLNKLLRTMLILDAYHPGDAKKYIHFVSPKVNPRDQMPLEGIFEQLRTEYPNISWHLITNEEFASQLLNPTLEKAAAVADTSELFMRSAKLLELSSLTGNSRNTSPPPQASSVSKDSSNTEPGKIQPLVKSLMKTLLGTSRELLGQEDLSHLRDPDYCKNELGLKLGNHALLRRQQDGREIKGHARYWASVYGDMYYVCSQWWRSDHLHNAKSLLRFVETLIDRQARNPGVTALEKHRTAFRDYLRKFCQDG